MGINICAACAEKEIKKVPKMICTPKVRHFWRCISHINNIISLLKANENYDVVLSDAPIRNIIVLAKENVGVMMINTKSPYCTFAFNEPNMVGAFWDYLSSIKKKHRAGIKPLRIWRSFFHLQTDIGFKLIV